jgi:hypothetical protein
MTVEHFARASKAVRNTVDEQVDGMRNLLARLPEQTEVPA